MLVGRCCLGERVFRERMGVVGSLGSCVYVGRVVRASGREMGWGRGGWVLGFG